MIMLKRMVIVLACILALFLTSCGPQKTPPSKPAQNTPSQPATEEPKTPAAAPKAFAASEVSEFFQLTEKDILKKFGKPSEEKVYEFYGNDKAKDMIYPDDGTFSVMVTQDQSGEIFHGIVKNDKIEHPRGIKIGDTLESVLAKFPNESDGTKTKDEEDPDREYEVIYGEYVHMSPFGLLEYKAGVPVTFTVSDQDLSISLWLENKKVSAVEYIIATD